MHKFVLTCCSTADLPMSYFQKRNVPFVCFHYNMDGKEYPDDLGQTVSFDEFYKRVAAGAVLSTSQVNVEQFITFFEPFLMEGMDILHISLSSGLSGSYESALVAQKELTDKYPDRKIYIVDSLGASSGYGLLVDALTDMRDADVSVDEAYKWALDNRLRVHHWFFSTDLTHYKRGGRISASSAFIGGLLNICPFLNMDNNGKLIQRKNIRGKKNVILEMVNMMEEHAQGGLEYNGKCFISNSACYADARGVADLVEERFKNLDGKVMINSVGTVIGSHTGPGTVALFFFGDERVD